MLAVEGEIPKADEDRCGEDAPSVCESCIECGGEVDISDDESNICSDCRWINDNNIGHDKIS